MATKKAKKTKTKKPKPKAKEPERKKSKSRVQNVRLDEGDMAVLDQALVDLGGYPVTKSFVTRAALKRGLQGLVKGGITLDKVKRANRISFS